jgi:hypothetical protein
VEETLFLQVVSLIVVEIRRLSLSKRQPKQTLLQHEKEL